ncbi:MAG: phosphonate C-P lyase system protein PhnG [Hoeflea sp.]|uniref:phosphonate C-P lyase system protein PhnG n=1 Tax=Hoeflea sp. TaxID=1940281 RepID=UPI001DB2798F|nr:phosphonate C-P lyase system protein PhnG [Hoeflea sp.]MBU4528785.1 phosphonate C-P lyase system protein PhnG [Alphaproteobacteria bacterium]MBU4545888.1 phosphonate C-P lyase system protein PhnG [Alphaproteobacteria bacterium]MBU4549919.1 phosphonate C-P lyase system protein PhnG [Alphaproteobacteria bacterium]MBV1725916.1 phosphonate C-P lyase system protein PhnG [Hoeflea sp.]MBV1762641.1 phosphonate C-P lyase system protein PhnG [Hoeflea sp.]
MTGAGHQRDHKPAPDAGEVEGRQRRLSVLAKAPGKELLACWKQTGLDPSVELLRGPESGLVALRGRIGGSGQPFHVGEISATRVTVRIGSGQVGHAMISGRDVRKAQLVAVIDALAQDPAQADLIERDIIAPLERLAEEADARLRSETAATRVNFFTMVRGED